MRRLNHIKIIGNNIKHLRQRENWTQSVLATKLDISIPAFSKIETGNTNCQISRIFQLADLFSVHVTQIILPENEYSQFDCSEEIRILKENLKTKDEEIERLQSRTIRLYEELRDVK